MKNVWVVVANASRAFFYASSKADPDLQLIKKLYHPEGKLKETELGPDQPGHNQKGSYEPHTSAKELEKEHFVKQLCEEMEHGRVSNTYTAIIVIAEPHFYGLIHRLAPHQVQKLIQNHFPKDYAHFSEHDLEMTLKDLLADTLKSLFYK